MSRKEKMSSGTMYSEFATRLRALMANRGINQSKLAKAAGVARQTINNYVLGQSVPKGDSLKKLSDVLGVSVDFLQGVSDVENPDSSIQGAVQCTGLHEGAIKKIVNLSKFQKSVLSDIIASPKFNGFLDAFDEAIEISGQAWQLMEAFELGLDENASISDMERSGSIYEETHHYANMLQGYRYTVFDSVTQLLNEINGYDKIIELFRTLHSQDDPTYAKLEERHKKEVEQNGLD